jgi:hypothetical protein
MSDSIATLSLIGRRPNGEAFPILLSVGAPYRNTEVDVEEWRCSVSLEPLYSCLAHAAGVDSVQALCMALSLGIDLLGKFVEDGGSLLNDDGTEFPLQSYAFGHGNRMPGVAA